MKIELSFKEENDLNGLIVDVDDLNKSIIHHKKLKKNEDLKCIEEYEFILYDLKENRISIRSILRNSNTIFVKELETLDESNKFKLIINQI